MSERIRSHPVNAREALGEFHALVEAEAIRAEVRRLVAATGKDWRDAQADVLQRRGISVPNPGYCRLQPECVGCGGCPREFACND